MCCSAPECPAAAHARSFRFVFFPFLSFAFMANMSATGPRCRVSGRWGLWCKPKAVSGIVLMTSLSLSFSLFGFVTSPFYLPRKLSLSLTLQLLKYGGRGGFEKRNLSFLLTKRTIRHVNPLHFFPKTNNPSLFEVLFQVLFFFLSFFLLYGRVSLTTFK